MNTLLPNCPTAGGGPFAIHDIMAKLHEAQIDTFGHFLTMLPQWREHGAIDEATYHVMDERLSQLFEYHRGLAVAYGASVPLAVIR